MTTYSKYFRVSHYTFALLALLLSASNSWAQLCDGPATLVNQSFEVPDISVTPPVPVQTFNSGPFSVHIYNEADVPGWETSAADNLIELWQSGFNGVISFDGLQHAEINANVPGAFFQDFPTVPGITISWQFAHRGRAGTDTLELFIGAPGSTVSQGTFATGNTAWDIKRGTYTIPPGQTTTRFEYFAFATFGGSLGAGNFIDLVTYGITCDYGDAPASFPVTNADNGAAHLQDPTARLGTLVDNDPDGQPSAAANADDNNNSDDDDGVQFNPSSSAGEFARGRLNEVVVTATAAGFINAWIDLNGDGLWQTSEQVASDVAISAGANSLTVNIPGSTPLGNTYARFRYTTDNPAGTLSFTGEWPNGEVEDYQILVTDIPPESTLWHFDEFSWTGAAGEAVEQQGTGINGTPTNGPSIGHTNGALDGDSGTCNYGIFDGVNDVVELGNPALLNFSSPPDTLTLMAWVRPAALNGGRHNIISRGNSGTGGARREIALISRGNRYEIRQRVGATVTLTTLATTAADIGTWVHLAAVFNGTQWTLYRDGVASATTASSGPQTSLDAEWAIGGRSTNNGGGQNFEGAIDEVRIFNTALSTADVQFFRDERHDCPKPIINVQKEVTVESDPINLTVNPKAIPEATLIYKITVSNSGVGGTTPNTLVISDDLSAQYTFFSGAFDGASPIRFTDGATSSNVQLDFTSLSDASDDIVFLNGSGSAITPNGGFDATVRGIRLEFDEPFAPNNASFTIEYRVRLE